ncbi:hypothetical protein TNCV_3385541 [Trichonephila clavipes]|uniref:Uncharacterized protein n=1 Tax=Trichonephila clavipes TaxID=2585209 RepID=A0A8X6T3W9_TRICX|nr:hypothetical protein TNCV_3385541 [Trichonephila clavipes]
MVLRFDIVALDRQEDLLVYPHVLVIILDEKSHRQDRTLGQGSVTGGMAPQYQRRARLLRLREGSGLLRLKKYYISRTSISSSSDDLSSVELDIFNILKICIATISISDHSLEFIHSQISNENGGYSLGIAAAAMDNTTSPNFDVSVFDCEVQSTDFLIVQI